MITKTGSELASVLLEKDAGLGTILGNGLGTVGKFIGNKARHASSLSRNKMIDFMKRDGADNAAIQRFKANWMNKHRFIGNRFKDVGNAMKNHPVLTTAGLGAAGLYGINKAFSDRQPTFKTY